MALFGENGSNLFSLYCDFCESFQVCEVFSFCLFGFFFSFPCSNVLNTMFFSEGASDLDAGVFSVDNLLTSWV